MDNKATWIWYPGDCEVWLGNKFNNRRTERGAMFPPFWKQDSHWVTVEFSKTVVLDAAETGAIVTVEEHSVCGGLGAAVAEVVCQQKPAKMKLLGLPDEYLYSGTNHEVFAHYGLTPDGIAAKVEELCR